MEIIKIFDWQGNYLGQESRDVAHRDGLWHETFHCWIIRKREGKVYVLFQKRAAEKKTSPNMLDIPAAGHLMADETKEDGVRELQEELGISVPIDKMKYLGVRIEVVDSKEQCNREFQHVYLLEDNTPLSDYSLQASEVSGLVEVELTQGLKLFFGEIDEIKCDSVFLKNGIKVKDTYLLHREDVISRPDGYYKKIFILADLYFKGFKYLSI